MSDSCNPTPLSSGGGGTPAACTTATCPLSNLAVRVTHEVTGAPIVGADVMVAGLGSKPTNAQGWAIWEKINPGTYDVRARKKGHVPDPGERFGLNVPPNTSVTTEIKLVLLELHMHVDNDRDGTVNDDWDKNDKWEAGVGKKGAVILCNNDDDDSDKKMDWENEILDTDADIPDIAPLYLRKKPAGRAFPAGWKAILSVSHQDKIRIFDKHAAGGKEIIGPNKGNSFDITDLSPDEHRFGMEGTQYPDAAFDGKITLTLKLLDNAGTEIHTEAAIVRVSPWIMFHHACPTTRIYVVATADNATFRTALTAAIGGLPLQVASEATYGTDRWMQDAMEPGFASLPKTGAAETRNTPATLRTYNDRSAMGWGQIDKYAKDELLGPDYGFTQATAPGLGESLDSFGNLECSPPFKHGGTGRDYKFGRIIYGGGGRVIHLKVRQFLASQKVQEPFEIDTDWLIVGHVDEVMSFLPLPAAPKGFKVMTASPKMALDIVKAAPDATKLLQGILLTGGTTQAEIDGAYPLTTAGVIKGDAAFQAVQATVQGKIDGIKGTMKNKLDLLDSDFIDLPVLFKEDGGRYVAYTPGIVNMLVITKTPSSLVLCVPKPFGPIVGGGCKFEAKVRSQLNFPGITIAFIDDFTTYHMLFGEIHCGTNSQRKPPADRWWWDLDWV